MGRMKEYLYNSLPSIYRDRDTNLELKRYLDTLTDAGFERGLLEVDGIADLINPDKCPSKFLPYLCENFGITYKYDVPEIFQRKLLKSISEFYKRKGSKSVIHFLARELSGLTVDIVEEENPSGRDRKYFKVLMKVFEDDGDRLLVLQDVISRYVQEFVPVTVDIEVVVSYQELEMKNIKENVIEEMGIWGIVEKIYYSVVKNILEEEHTKVEISEVIDLKGKTQANSSLANVGVIGINLYTNVINGIDKITQSGIENTRVY